MGTFATLSIKLPAGPSGGAVKVRTKAYTLYRREKYRTTTKPTRQTKET